MSNNNNKKMQGLSECIRKSKTRIYVVHKKTILNINTPANFKFSKWKKLWYVTSNHKKAGITLV